jgi:hypothetical protein
MENGWAKESTPRKLVSVPVAPLLLIVALFDALALVLG